MLQVEQQQLNQDWLQVEQQGSVRLATGKAAEVKCGTTGRAVEVNYGAAGRAASG